MRGYLANPAMKFSVFIHKAEALSEDYRGGASPLLAKLTCSENYSEIQRAMTEELEDFQYSSLQAYAPHLDLSDSGVCNNIFNHMVAEIKFDMTSVHDVSLRDAWSKVLQGIMEMLPAVEALLLNFTEVRNSDRSFANCRRRVWTTPTCLTLLLVSSLPLIIATATTRRWSKSPSTSLGSFSSEKFTGKVVLYLSMLTLKAPRTLGCQVISKSRPRSL